MAAESLARITRVVLKNYKSIVHCDVELKPLTILVGPNGSGKSAFLDALRFVSEALTVGLEQAVYNRGNVAKLVSATVIVGASSRGAVPTGALSFGVEIHFSLPDGRSGS